MRRWIIASGVVVLALGAGVAYAATQLSSAAVTQVCVNDTNGLMRASSTCREGEHLATIGGGGGAQVTQMGSFTVAAGQTDGKTLPLTGIKVSGTCVLETPGGFTQLLARASLEAASGKTMDALVTEPSGGGTLGGQSLLIPQPLSVDSEFVNNPGGATVVATSNSATATISMGAKATGASSTPTCTFLWQAVEAAN